MKLASLRHGRDGQLVVVSRDLSRCVAVPHIAPTLQRAMDEWTHLAPRLMRVYELLNDNDADGAKPFNPRDCASPLPRAYQWADGSAYVTHVELVRKARGAEMPPSFWTDPLMYQGGSDCVHRSLRADRRGRRSLGHRFRGGSRGHHRRRAGRSWFERGRASHQASDAGQRRKPAQSDPVGARKEFRLLPVEAGLRIFAGGRDAGRAWRSVVGRQGPSAADGRFQRRALRRAQCRRRHDIFVSAIDRACREDAGLGRRHDRRFGHGVQQGSFAWLLLHRGAPHA